MKLGGEMAEEIEENFFRPTVFNVVLSVLVLTF